MQIKLLNYLVMFPFVVVMLLTMTGCATEGLGSDNYSRGQTRGEQSVRMGIVESVRKVKIEGTRSGLGTIAGAGVGGLAGSQIGRGKGRIAGAIGGALLGGIAGQAMEQGVTKQDGLEITVRLENDEIIAVTQGAEDQFHIGDRVRVLKGSGVTRISH